MKIRSYINFFYYLPTPEPSFYNDLINIEKIPIFNDLKNNFNEIKKELVNNFSLFSKEEEKYYLYPELEAHVKPKNETVNDETLVSAYYLHFPYISSDSVDELNEEEKEKINIFLNSKKTLIKNKIEELNLEEKMKINFMIKLKKMSPFTTNIIKNLQEKQILTTCFVSKLKPNSYIKPHKDPPSDNVLRVHYCLVNDENCSLTVGDETRKWKENDFLIFNSYGIHKHSVNHDGTIDRIVLVFDLKRSYLEPYYK